jgi:molybdate transport system substrate-binding protein
MPRRFARSNALVGVVLLTAQLLWLGCQRSDPPPPAAQSAASVASPASRAQTPKPETELVVFAAASLQDVFKTLAETFKQGHQGVKVTFNFAGTQELRTQVEQGAIADVFASADQKHMGALITGGYAMAPLVFARNEPVIIVAQESAAAVKGLADLPKLSRIVIGTPDVPIGRYTLQILDKAAAKLGSDFPTLVQAKVVSRELNVRQVLAKVSLGEAQAGIVYRTDARTAADKVSVVTIPPDQNVIAQYPIAQLKNAAHPRLANDWMTLVLTAPGQAALQEAGFLIGNAPETTP